MTNTIPEIPSIQILGTRVHMAEIPDVISMMDHWIQTEPEEYHHVVNTGMHGVMEGHRNREFKNILNAAELLAPDGVLALFIARLRGFRLNRQNTGPELLWRFSETAHRKGYSYYLLGDTPETLATLSTIITREFPNVKVAGFHSPPFHPLTIEEDDSICDEINRAKPDVLWVGLGMPKQEWWISEHRNRLNVPVVVGAGASFKFISGTVKRAPPWLRNLGFEWLWRLMQEPGRVWRRVFVDAPQFIGLVALQLSGIKKYR